MPDLESMSSTAVSQRPAKEYDHMVVSIRLIPPLPYSPTVVPADELRMAIIQASRERRAKEREAALNGNAE